VHVPLGQNEGARTSARSGRSHLGKIRSDRGCCQSRQREAQQSFLHLDEAVLGNQTSHHKMADYFFTDDRVKVQLVKLLGELVHENLKAAP
jgi:hypothetical protein